MLGAASTVCFTASVALGAACITLELDDSALGATPGIAPVRNELVSIRAGSTSSFGGPAQRFCLGPGGPFLPG